ncbi:MAG: XRE family transcriptional regulator [Victivallaceae bacterium]
MAVDRSLFKKRNLAQRDLAEFLEITAPAVTQAKRGRLTFNYLQLALLCDFLNLRAPEIAALFTEALNARLARCEARGPGRKPRRVRGLRVTAKTVAGGNGILH